MAVFTWDNANSAQIARTIANHRVAIDGICLEIFPSHTHIYISALQATRAGVSYGFLLLLLLSNDDEERLRPRREGWQQERWTAEWVTTEADTATAAATESEKEKVRSRPSVARFVARDAWGRLGWRFKLCRRENEKNKLKTSYVPDDLRDIERSCDIFLATVYIPIHVCRRVVNGY